MGKRVYFAVIALAASTMLGVGATEARRDAALPLPVISAADLPSEARATLERIRDNRTFPYDRDGVTFGNYEGMLPAKPRGYYHEYTVKTPGTKSRGARRIVCGGEKGTAVGTLANCYYSDDHYQSFKSIRP